MPFRAETIRGYLQAAHQQFLSDYAVRTGQTADDTPDDMREALRNKDISLFETPDVNPAVQARIETRFLYNQDFESIYAQVPGSIALLLVIVPAILMALSIVREKELGSITNLYVDTCHAHRVPARQTNPQHHDRHDQFWDSLSDGNFHIRCPNQGKFLWSCLSARCSM